MRAIELERILFEYGWYVKNPKGSHRRYKPPTKPGRVTIPFHNGDMIREPPILSLNKQGLNDPAPYKK